MKLGKLAPKPNSKTLFFNKYLKADSVLPEPAKNFWEYKVPDYPMMGNSEIGDCTCACIGHMIQTWTAHSGALYTPPDTDIIRAYSAVSGYDPSTGANDSGAAITDVLNYTQTTGVSGHKIDGWVQIDATSIDHIKQAIYVFGGVDIGVQLPNSAMTQFNSGQPWDVLSNDGGIDGGHSIPLFGYGSAGATCVTWAKRQQMSWDWFQKYCDEAYAAVSLDWLNSQGIAANHLDLSALQSDLQLIKN